MWQVYLLTFLAKIGIKRFTIQDLHSGILGGYMPASALYGLMRVNQVESFIAYHGLVKELLEMLDHAASPAEAMAKDAQARVEEFLSSHEELRNWMLVHTEKIVDARERTVLKLRLNQIDNMIERDLEKAIRRHAGEKNVVRRED